MFAKEGRTCVLVSALGVERHFFIIFSIFFMRGPVGCQVAAGAAGSVQIGLGNILWVPQAWQSRPDD